MVTMSRKQEMLIKETLVQPHFEENSEYEAEY